MIKSSGVYKNGRKEKGRRGKMKFKILKDRFAEALKSVQNIVAGKGTFPIMQNVLLSARGKELSLTTTDLDISISSITDCETIETGSSTLPVKLLFSMIAKLPEGEVLVEIDATDKALIKSCNVSYKLPGLPESDFPRIKKSEQTNEFKVSAPILKEMFRKTSYAASQDDTRRTLKGVLMSFKDGKLTMVATDGRRLAMVERELEFSKESEIERVVPYKAVAELQRSLPSDGEVKISSSASQMCFSFNNTEIYTKLIDDKYPDYRQVIPENMKERITVDRQALLDALDRASIMTLDEAHSTKLIFSNGKLVVCSSATDKGEAKDEVVIKYAGEIIEILFNPTYIMDCLKAIDDDEVVIEIKDSQKPALIRCTIPFLYVLMPLRTN